MNENIGEPIPDRLNKGYGQSGRPPEASDNKIQDLHAEISKFEGVLQHPNLNPDFQVHAEEKIKQLDSQIREVQKSQNELDEILRSDSEREDMV